MNSIKIFVMDVDGTLTDGKIYIGDNGEMFKAFNIKDGYGIHEILPSYGIKTVIMTGRDSKSVLNRASELEVNYVLQNIKDKENALVELADSLNCGLNEIAYIGDDIIDVKAMKLCGITGCPADAADAVKNVSNFVSPHKGGEGAVRSFIDWLIAAGVAAGGQK